MIQILNALDALAGIVLMVCAVLAWAAMSHQTRHCWRFTYWLIGVAGLALFAAPFCEVPAFFGVDLMRYVSTAILVGFALYMALDRRRVRPMRDAVPVAEDPDKTVPQLRRAALLALAGMLIVGHDDTEAAPIAMATGQGVQIMLTDEACALPAVKNLAGRITWVERGKTTEGCYGVSGVIVIAYFADLTVVLIPLREFAKADPA